MGGEGGLGEPLKDGVELGHSRHRETKPLFEQ